MILLHLWHLNVKDCQSHICVYMSFFYRIYFYHQFIRFLIFHLVQVYHWLYVTTKYVPKYWSGRSNFLTNLKSSPVVIYFGQYEYYKFYSLGSTTNGQTVLFTCHVNVTLTLYICKIFVPKHHFLYLQILLSAFMSIFCL